MKLTKLYIKNFQSIRGETEVDLEKLTFLYGPNSAGKSSIIDAYSIIKNLVTDEDYSFFPDSTLGFSVKVDLNPEFLDATYNDWGFEELLSTDRVYSAMSELDGKTLSYRVSSSRNRVPDRIELKVDDQYLFIYSDNRQNIIGQLHDREIDGSQVPEGDDYPAIAFNKSFKSLFELFEDWMYEVDADRAYGRYQLHGDYVFTDFEIRKFLTLSGEVYYSGDMAVVKPFADYLKALQIIISEVFTLSHVKGDRQVIPRDSFYYQYDANSPYRGFGFRRNWAEPPIKGTYFNPDTPYAHWADYFFSDYKDSLFARSCIEKYLKSLHGYQFKITEETLNSDKILRFKIVNRQGVLLDFEDVGSGLSYVFPIIGSLSFFKNSFIEQPELHLHPAAQCEISDVFIAARSLGHNAIVESHSEHMLLRVLRRIRETTQGYLIREELKLCCDDVTILYFDPDDEGKSDVLEIRIDEHGEFLNNWPNGFFSEREKELFQEHWEGAPDE